MTSADKYVIIMRMKKGRTMITQKTIRAGETTSLGNPVKKDYSPPDTGSFLLTEGGEIMTG